MFSSFAIEYLEMFVDNNYVQSKFSGQPVIDYSFYTRGVCYGNMFNHADNYGGCFYIKEIMYS